MFSEKSNNEYGEFLVYKQIKEPTNLTIVYLHDFLFSPEIHDNFCKDLKIFNYYGLYIPFARRKEYDEELKYEKININYFIRYVKDFILSLNTENIFLIAEGITGPIGLIVSTILNKVVKKLVLVNPYNSKVSPNTLDMLLHLPTNIDECYAFLTKILGNNSKLLNRGRESEIVISTMRRICYNYDELSDFALNLTLPKTLETIKVYELNIKIPTLLIISENNNFIKPIEQLSAYKNNTNVKIVQFPNDTCEPIVQNEKIYFETVMKFFIDGIGLNSETYLPNKDIYKYLSDEWKQYYRYEFADKLNERERKDYLDKLNKYEKEINDQVQNNPFDEETTNTFVEQQIQAVNQVYDYVKQNFKQQQIYEKTSKLNLVPDIIIDFNYMPNKIYQNSQGYFVYHDGNGNGYYKDQNGNWKKVINKSNLF